MRSGGKDPSKSLWDFYDETKLKGIDLILSAGDLPPAYLSFLVTFSNCPLLYVHGNHDDIYDVKPPEGCICIDDQIYVHEGIRILGLGGSMRYNNGRYQCTEKDMAKRIRKVGRQIRKNRGVDVIVTHAAPTGLGDRKDPAHQGFDCFLELMERCKPAFLVHGHVHMNYDSDIPRVMTYGDTTVINAYERYFLEIPGPND